MERWNVDDDDEGNKGDGWYVVVVGAVIDHASASPI
jgi:hypothetical protein